MKRTLADWNLLDILEYFSTARCARMPGSGHKWRRRNGQATKIDGLPHIQRQAVLPRVPAQVPVQRRGLTSQTVASGSEKQRIDVE